MFKNTIKFSVVLFFYILSIVCCPAVSHKETLGKKPKKANLSEDQKVLADVKDLFSQRAISQYGEEHSKEDVNSVNSILMEVIDGPESNSLASILESSVPQKTGYYKKATDDERTADGALNAVSKMAMSEKTLAKPMLESSETLQLFRVLQSCDSQEWGNLVSSLQRKYPLLVIERIRNTLAVFPEKRDEIVLPFTKLAYQIASKIPLREQTIETYRFSHYAEKDLASTRIQDAHYKNQNACQALKAKFGQGGTEVDLVGILRNNPELSSARISRLVEETANPSNPTEIYNYLINPESNQLHHDQLSVLVKLAPLSDLEACNVLNALDKRTHHWSPQELEPLVIAVVEKREPYSAAWAARYAATTAAAYAAQSALTAGIVSVGFAFAAPFVAPAATVYSTYKGWQWLQNSRATCHENGHLSLEQKNRLKAVGR